MTRAICIDPGTRVTGVAILCLEDGVILASGLITPAKLLGKSDPTISERIAVVRAKTRQLIKEYKPTELWFENTSLVMQKGYRAKDALAALKVSLEDLAKDNRLAIYLVAPTTIKKRMTGNGRANKDQVIDEVIERWGVFPRDDNHADALAIAWLVKNHRDELIEQMTNKKRRKSR